MQSRRQTAWRKSRKFGDVYGGRVRPRVPDGIFKRAHSLKPPGPHEQVPILIQENPSREYIFPLSAAEILAALEALPKRHTQGITHVWLRRRRPAESAAGSFPLAEFVCGSGVRAVILYPWHREGTLCIGRALPAERVTRDYTRYGAAVFSRGGLWYVRFGEEDLRRFYVQHLLFHEVGHHVDRFRRHWSKANSKQVEDFADQYAFQRTATATHLLNRLRKKRAV